MMPTIVWSKKSKADLASILRYVGERNPWAADKLIQTIQKSTLPLLDHPYMFRESQKIPGCREIVAAPNYLVFYRVELNCIRILRVVHGRRQFPQPMS